MSEGTKRMLSKLNPNKKNIECETPDGDRYLSLRNVLWCFAFGYPDNSPSSSSKPPAKENKD